MSSQSQFVSSLLPLVALKSDASVEITTEGIKYLSLLKNSKLSIISCISSSSSILSSFIDTKFPSSSTPGIFIWGNPITLQNGQQLLLVNTSLSNDDNNNENQKLFMLSALISNCVIYDITNDNDEHKLISLANIKSRITIPKLKETSMFTEKDNLLSFLPWLVVVSDNKEIQYDFKQDSSLSALYPKIDIVNSIEGISSMIKKDIKYKSIGDIIIDGDSLFGIMQNYIDAINNDENPDISTALENVLLSKAKNIAEKNIENFKNTFIKTYETKTPISISEIYKEYFNEEKKEISNFTSEIKDILNALQSGDYITKNLTLMQNEVDSLIERTKESNEEWIEAELKDLEKILTLSNNTVDDIKDIDSVKDFIAEYNDELLDFITKLSDTPNINMCSNILDVIKRVFNDFVANVYNQLSDKIDNIYSEYKNEKESNIKTLEDNVKRLNEENERNKNVIEGMNKEKSELNKENIELQNKYEKISRESKTKEKEKENQLTVEVQKYQKMEQYYTNIIKQKESDIQSLNETLDKTKKELNDKNSELQKTIKTLQKDIDNIQMENEKMKVNGSSEEEHSTVYKSNNDNLSSLFQNIQNTFIEFKQSLEKLEKENETAFKTKYLELSTKEIESKAHNWIDEIRIFREDQIKSLSENYEKNLQKAKNEIDDLTFQLTTISHSFNEATQLKKENDAMIASMKNQMSQIESISNSKDTLIKKQKEEIKLLNEKIKELKKIKEDLDLNLNKNILNYKMKEDELETMVMVIDGMLSHRKDKYEHNLRRLGSEMKTAVEIISKEYKIFT